MQCFIYKSLKKDELYLYLDKRDNFSVVPDVLLQNFGRLAFVMEVMLTPERKLARENVEKVIASIHAKGFFVQMPPLVITSPLAASQQQLH
jgi:uncharacterized protein